jgi:hypothetical protein
MLAAAKRRAAAAGPAERLESFRAPVLIPAALPPPLQVLFVGMMQYDGDLLLPKNFLVPPPEINHVSGQYLVGSGVKTFAVSETQKFGHVTFFWNGNRSGYFDSKLETYLEVRGGRGAEAGAGSNVCGLACCACGRPSGVAAA